VSNFQTVTVVVAIAAFMGLMLNIPVSRILLSVSSMVTYSSWVE